MRRILGSAVEALRVDLSATQRDALVNYVELLAHWNRTYNLTAVRDPQAMMIQHVVDCLAVVGPLRRELAHAVGRRVLDVGSGGGLPGAVIAVAAPDVEVVCVDSVAKKTAFVSHMSGALHLDNLSAWHGRIEDLATKPFDLICSRAFAALHAFVAATGRLLASEGVWMAMKGKPPADEIAKLQGTATVFHVERLTVPGLSAERCLVWMRALNGDNKQFEASTH
ncbi:MAG: 16S rRNA (guanine(527)-N(7))-methyltransferase RsmG [Caldimonas sp.]